MFTFIIVLILVLMEDTLGGLKVPNSEPTKRLNPCFNGRYSRRHPFTFKHSILSS